MNSQPVLQSQNLRLKNENQMLKKEVDAQNIHIKELTAHIRTRTASTFVEKVQQMQKPIQDSQQYIELEQNYNNLVLEKEQLTQQYNETYNELTIETQKSHNLTLKLTQFQTQMKELLTNSKKIHKLNSELQIENEELKGNQITQLEFQEEINQLTQAFQAVQDQLMLENNELSQQIIDLKAESADYKNRTMFAKDQQQASQQQAELWQQNYQTLLTQFKNAKNIDKTVRFGDKVQEIKWNIEKQNSKNEVIKLQKSYQQSPQNQYLDEINLILDKDNQQIQQQNSPTKYNLEQSLTDSLKNKLTEMLHEEHDMESTKNEQDLNKLFKNFRKNQQKDQIPQESDIVLEGPQHVVDSMYNELEESDYLALNQSVNTQPDVSLSRICNDMLNYDETSMNMEIEELEKSISQLQQIKTKLK
ncbi:hypothetical protein SS50377_27494 [Spironucleus salmonicida]|uniref:Uncharacterized protein n=1 Tax=Spironucleus salmonicida TaxID=348837 RepID=V6LQG2_9EUKA|nr:hypothetical protein SS50377_27494 [Spironucleus salmonicida]|eukprot:EST46912.1 Hypothetical protein SS50377_13067 [Spironucleus salmonicida]